MKDVKSKFGQLISTDFIKAFWLFLSTTVLGIVGDAILQQAKLGHYSFAEIHWQELGFSVLLAVLGYLKVKLITNSNGEILTKEPVSKI